VSIVNLTVTYQAVIIVADKSFLPRRIEDCPKRKNSKYGRADRTFPTIGIFFAPKRPSSPNIISDFDFKMKFKFRRGLWPRGELREAPRDAQLSRGGRSPPVAGRLAIVIPK
jgi:hypothetical protein